MGVRPALLAVLLAACHGELDESVDTGGEQAPLAPWPVQVLVTLDGEPVQDAVVVQGGTTTHARTDAEGRVTVVVDPEVPGEHVLVAAHPEARADAAYAFPDEAALELALVRYEPVDNPEYVFQDPGTPSRRETTAQCAHCHISITDAWYASPHRTAASNPVVHDLYAGVAAHLADEADCLSAGGDWRQGLQPGTGEPAWRCYLGEGVLPALNPGCDDEDLACDGHTTAHGACADCHAPGIDGQLGGRDLLEATGHAYSYGVHCDVCHRVDRVDLEAAAGVAGRLVLQRPAERIDSPGLGTWLPLTFGPHGDVPNPRMGAVGREHFHQATLCAGCHEYDQPALVPGTAIDTDRWPEGRIPVHSTYSEWLDGPFAEISACQACHMPPDPTVGNGADLYNLWEGPPGIAAGWPRPPGTVRKHAWLGPRQPDAGLHRLAATLDLEHGEEDGTLVARVTVRNAGCGHALPTGEPLRAMVLRVQATCEGEPLVAVGGDAVPDFGLALGVRDPGEDWLMWPGAQVGQVLRVVQVDGWRDYVGPGRFGDGSFDLEARGLPLERVVGERAILAVDGDGRVTLSSPLPPGDRVYLGEPGFPEEGAPATAQAGAPGFAFARVMVDAEGRRMVPHFLAVDVASDNRVLPQGSVTTEHRFEGGCAEPQVQAVLLHRAFPVPLARERGWDLRELLMAEVER